MMRPPVILTLAEEKIMLGFGPIGSAPIGALPEEMARDLLEVVNNSQTPEEAVREILVALKDVSESKRYSDLAKNEKYKALKKWIPDTPEKLAAYAAIAALILQMITKYPPQKIEINNTFIQQYEIILNSNSSFDQIVKNKNRHMF